MAKRLQVILQYPEYREIQKIARSRRMSLAQGGRPALGVGWSPGASGSRRQETRSDPRRRTAPLPHKQHRHHAGRNREGIRNRSAAVILIDSNIPMYLVGALTPPKAHANPS